MIWFFVIFVGLAIVALWIYFSKKSPSDKVIQREDSSSIPSESREVVGEKASDEIVTFLDDSGQLYYEREVVNYIPRKTFIYGVLESKYYGEEHPESVLFSSRQDFYKIFLYDTILKVVPCRECKVFHVEKHCNGLHREKEGRFDIGPDAITSNEWLPSEIRCDMIGVFQKKYQVKLLEPEINDIEINPLLHQKEGEEVFGTLKAKVTGFVLDFVEERFIQQVPVSDFHFDTNGPVPLDMDSGDTVLDSTVFVALSQKEGKDRVGSNGIYRTKTPTGSEETKPNYRRREYFMSDYKTKYWDSWKYEAPKRSGFDSAGCLSVIPSIFLLFVVGTLLFVYLPQVLFFIPLFAVPYLFSLIPSRAWNWIFGLIGVIIFGTLAFNIYNAVNGSSRRTVNPRIIDSPEEKRVQVIDDRGIKRDYTDNAWNQGGQTTNLPAKDSIVCFHRIWEDAKGNAYEGDYCLKISEVADCGNFRANLNLQMDHIDPYHLIYEQLARHDSVFLFSVYSMIENITKERKLNHMTQADMIVSFVQDFEYALVLESSCDPGDYNDPFITEYLRNQNGPCNDNVRYGVYSPIEFLFHRAGDCDTRTLLLYTILDHFGYNVILMTSMYYRHSIIGVDVAGSGTEVNWRNGHYLLWETTVPSLPSGVIADDMLDFKHWQVSLSNKI